MPGIGCMVCVSQAQTFFCWVVVVIVAFHLIRGRFWGKDFRAWSDVKNSKMVGVRRPLSVNDGGLGYYDLMHVDVRKTQADLARRAGVCGFVFHHYW